MTANEMKIELLRRFDFVYQNDSPGLTDSEIASLLTEAEFHFVENNLPTKDFNTESKANLKTLYKTENLERVTDLSSSQDGVFTNGEYWDIPDDIFHVLSEEAKITSDKTCFNNTHLPVLPKNFDEYNSNIKNPFKQPNRDKIWRLEDEGVKVQLIKPTFVTSITEYKLNYIKRPLGIVPYDAGTTDGTTNALVNSILPEITHQKIVNLAVTKTLKYLGLNPELQADLAIGEQLK